MLSDLLNFDWLAGVPLSVARWIFLGLFIGIGILVWRLPDEEIYAGVDHPRWWHNLRIWATVVLAMIFVTYLIF